MRAIHGELARHDRAHRVDEDDTEVDAREGRPNVRRSARSVVKKDASSTISSVSSVSSNPRRVRVTYDAKTRAPTAVETPEIEASRRRVPLDALRPGPWP